MRNIKMKFRCKLFLTNFFILVGDYHMIYKVYYAINPEGELTIIASIQYNGSDKVFLIEIIGCEK